MPAGSLVPSVLFVIDHPIAQVLIAEAESSTLLLRSGAGNHGSKEQCERDKSRVLVHCLTGKNRSAAIVAAFLMTSRGWRLAQSFQWGERLAAIGSPDGPVAILSSSNYENSEDLLLQRIGEQPMLMLEQEPWNADKQEASARNATVGARNQLADNDPIDARWQLHQQWWRLW
ncbi:unnamed protein product [Urochloa humidicola]